MSSNSQTASGPSSRVVSSHTPAIVIFGHNQARRMKVGGELDSLRSAFLERPTVDGLVAFAEKEIEYGDMMDDHHADLEAVIQKQLVVVEELERKAKLAEEHRVKEFQRALECMDPAEAKAAMRAERERPFHVQRQIAARAAALDAEFSREIARMREKYPM